jgi:hypothetical protein
MNKRYIYKHAIENSFFSIIINENDIEKVVVEGKPCIYMREDENTQVWWTYTDEEKRNNDFDVITELKYKMIG